MNRSGINKTTQDPNRYLPEIQIVWCRKSFLSGEFPFEIIKPEDWDNPDKVDINENSSDEFKPYTVVTCKNVPCFYVDELEFVRIGETLNPLASRFLKYEVFVICAGEKMLAINTQGFDYPQYKSWVRFMIGVPNQRGG